MKKQAHELDRLSALPDAIIFHIFSFLNMRVFVQSSILSNRWRYLWTSTPFLNFHLPLCKTRQKINRTRFISFVDRVFLLRDEESNSNILTFSLCCYENLEVDRVYTLLMAALKRNVQELCLETASTHFIELPDNLFTAKKISVLKLKGLRDSRVILPNTICLNNRIKSLELSSVKLPEGNSNGELIFSFTVMRSLVIRGCSFPGKLKRFTISAPQLERLELTNLFEDWNEPIQVNICTPKLKLLIYTGYIYGDYSLENLSVLVSAEISIWQRSGMEKDLFARYITNVLTGVYNVKKLLMPTWLVKTIAGSWILELLPIIFSNLRSMKLVECNGTNKTCIGEMASFLERLFHIESFVWSRGSQEMELGSIIKGDNSIKSNLKSIEIHNSQGSADELNLLEILLEQSIDLNKIIIKKSKSLSQDKYKLSTFCEKLSNLPQAFSRVKVEIVEDAQDPCFIKI